MKLGDTIITATPATARDTHLWFIVTDPDKDDDRRVLILNITTASRFHDYSCILNVGDHPFIAHDSCVNYGGGYINSVVYLESQLTRGAIEYRQPASPVVLQRIWDGASKSEYISLEFLEMLREQGYVND